MLRRSHSAIQTFEISLEGNSGRNDDIVILSGPGLEASANHVFGKLVLSTVDVTHVKKISIQLIGTLRLRWNDSGGSKNSTPPVKYEKQLYSQEFSDFEIPGKLVSVSNPNSRGTTPVHSLTNLTSYFGGGLKTKTKSPLGAQSPSSREHSPKMSRQSSATSLINLAGPYIGNNGSSSPPSHKVPNNMVYQMSPGVHEFPFDLVIPGDISESIEGNKFGQLVYWLVATVDRGKMHSKITTKQHLRIVRTVGVDSYDVAHTVSINNTWPKKVDYQIDVPCRAVPLGAKLLVHFAMIPLDKGLKLGRIRGEIVEYVALSTPISLPREEEHVVAQQFLEVSSGFDQFADEWEFTHLIDMPRSLGRCTQDAAVEPYIKINHKFRCFISLINRDGHTSELRASLPITVYISPHIYILGNPDEEAKPSKHNHQEQPMFNVERQARSPSTPNTDIAAPPTYSHHVYDKLYSAVPSPSESPVQSGAATPRISPSRPGSPMVLPNLDANQQAQLQAGLRQLALTRQNSYQSLARAGSSINIQALSRVPSYEEALNEKAAKETAPDYED